MKSPTFVPILALAIAATDTITGGRFMTYTGDQAGAAANTLGVARFDAVAGEDVTVDVLGVAVVEAGAAVAVGAALETDVNGRVVTRDQGPVVGRALSAASGAGRKIEVLLMPN